ncbi:MAG: Mut7-C ubiquitin/RNAse domain-containing protein [Chlorobiales bacterium]|nr:Mut7-C ubiquitin/RNAse domain-containing protein [Chlorobiales bacterium]
MPDEFNVYLDFSPDLTFFLQGAGGKTIQKRLSHATTVKDVIESCGVPHTEIGQIGVNGRAVDFEYRMFPEDKVTVAHVDPEVTGGFGLQPEPGEDPAFIADEHLAKLSRRMRVLGIDTCLFPGGSDRELLGEMQRLDRILLTRDRRLLMHRIVRSGYCIRSGNVVQQVCEVIGRFALSNAIKPFRRCPSCNGLLIAADKKALLSRLEPKTCRYYHDFFLCDSCGKIYWHGSHVPKLEAFVADIRRRCGYSEL